MKATHLLSLSLLPQVSGLLAGHSTAATLRSARRCVSPALGQGDELGGAISSTFGELFSGIFKPNADKEAEIDRAYAEQLEVAKRRKNPKAYAKSLARTEANRAAASSAFQDKFAWQRGKDPLGEFKKRQKAGKVSPLGYEDVPKGGIQLPSASFGVGGEFGVGGKYDNGERFDLRLPFADQGWVDQSAGTKGGWGARLGGAPPSPKKAPPRKQPPRRPAAKQAKEEPAPESGNQFLDWWIKRTTDS